VKDDCVSEVCVAGICAAATCADGVKNGGESDLDCGAACPPGCSTGELCLVSADCESLECAGAAVKTCAPPGCFDGHKNGDETDINCGGSCAQACPPGYGCLVNDDCIGEMCDPAALVCSPTCDDGFINQGESDPDCGGPCAGCPAGWHCFTSADCGAGLLCDLSGHCMP
jgi:hypothetical protein